MMGINYGKLTISPAEREKRRRECDALIADLERRRHEGAWQDYSPDPFLADARRHNPQRPTMRSRLHRQNTQRQEAKPKPAKLPHCKECKRPIAPTSRVRCEFHLQARRESKARSKARRRERDAKES